MYDKQRDNERRGLSKLQKSSLRDGPLEKLWGWGGGEFLSRRNFFSSSNSLYEFVLGRSMKYFLIGVHEVFFI